tara:strand:- start:12298 stop:13239 length:942 start_codon:yes stop_codon:yes gene_type:complete
MAEYVNKSSILEIDFLNNIVVDIDRKVVLEDGRSVIATQKFDGEYATRFLNSLDDFWNTENDQLQVLSFFSDGSLFCQRKKQKFDFVNDQKVYTTYTFVGYTEDQVSELLTKVKTFIETNKLAKEIKINQYVTKIDENILFFDKTYLKRLQEKNTILSVTDWRILPDVVDSYTGEKDRWILYRQKIRNMGIKPVKEYATPLEFFKAVRTLKWPIDPKTFHDLYPDNVNTAGDVVEYLGTDDQWVERDTDSSRDLIESRLSHIIAMRQNYVKAERETTSDVKEMMKLLQLEDFVEGGIDYTKIYTEEDINDMAE